MTDQHDADRLLKGARRDPVAFEALYRQMAPGILRWLRARVADTEVARDLLAETFAQVVCSADRYRGDTDEAAAGWVWGIARNLLRRYYRRQKVEGSARRRLDMLVRPGDEDGTGEFTAGDVSIGDRLRSALDGLPTKIRESVWLRVVDELSYDEIASRQGCSSTAARQRVSRGMRRLSVVIAQPQS